VLAAAAAVLLTRRRSNGESAGPLLPLLLVLPLTVVDLRHEGWGDDYLRVATAFAPLLVLRVVVGLLRGRADGIASERLSSVWRRF
jgi:hypothetical protein